MRNIGSYDATITNTGVVTGIINGYQLQIYAGNNASTIIGMEIGMEHNWTGSVPNNYIFYIDPSTNIGTVNNYMLYSLSTAPSLLSGSITSTQFIKSGGNSAQFLKADGSIDNSSYLSLTGGSMSNANLVTNLNAQYLNGYDITSIPISRNVNGTLYDANIRFDGPFIKSAYDFQNTQSTNIALLINNAYSPDWIEQENSRFLGSGPGDKYRRQFYNGTTWSPWLKMWDSGNFDPTAIPDQGSTRLISNLNAALLNSQPGSSYISLQYNYKDLNLIATDSIFNGFGFSQINGPIVDNFYNYISFGSFPGYGMQIANEYSGNGLYYRNYNNGTLSTDWTKLWDNGNFDPSGKQNTITGLTSGYLPNWNGSNLINSKLQQLSSGIKIFNCTDTDNSTLLFNGHSVMDAYIYSDKNTDDLVFNDKLRIKVNGDIVVQNTTASTSSTTGALTVAGGVGIGGNLNVGGSISSSNLFTNQQGMQLQTGVDGLAHLYQAGGVNLDYYNGSDVVSGLIMTSNGDITTNGEFLSSNDFIFYNQVKTGYRGITAQSLLTAGNITTNGNIYAGVAQQIQIIGGDHGGINFYASLGNQLTIQTTAYNNPIIFGINSIEKIRIASSGNIVIGTTDNGVDKLQVGGSVSTTKMKVQSATTTERFEMEFNSEDGSLDFCYYAN